MEELEKQFEDKFGELFGRFDDLENFNLSTKVWQWITENFEPKRANPRELNKSGECKLHSFIEGGEVSCEDCKKFDFNDVRVVKRMFNEYMSKEIYENANAQST